MVSDYMNMMAADEFMEPQSCEACKRRMEIEQTKEEWKVDKLRADNARLREAATAVCERWYNPPSEEDPGDDSMNEVMENLWLVLNPTEDDGGRTLGVREVDGE